MTAMPLPDPPPTLPPAPITARAQNQLRVLEEITQLGLQLLRATTQAALAPAPEPATPEPPTPEPPTPAIKPAEAALIFTRLSRALRQTLALETRIAEGPPPAAPPRATRNPSASPRDAAPLAELPLAKRDDKKRRVRNALERAVTAEHDGRDAEALLADLDERLDDPEFGPAFARTPAAFIVARLCEEFSLPLPFFLWSEEELGIGHPDWDTPPDEADDPDSDPDPPNTA